MKPAPDAPTPAPVTTGAVGQFFLEIAGLIGVARLGWHAGDGGAMGLALAALLVALAGALWGLFRTPGYVPNGQDPVVSIPGPARLVLEIGFFLMAAWGLWLSGWSLAAGVMLMSVAVIYWMLRDRTLGLARNRQAR